VFIAVKGSLSSNRGTLHGIDAADGQVKWTVNAAQGYGTGQLLFVGNTLLFCTDRILSALEPSTGRQLWSVTADDIGGPLVADDQRVYAVTASGRKQALRAFALATGQE
jgi:outer membrane protein assembly factor BamB